MRVLTAFLTVVLTTTIPLLAQDANEKKDPLPISQVLKLGVEGLTEFTGPSEVGQDEAAELFAAARRLTTEQSLGQKDVHLVMELQTWRQALSKFRDSIISLAYIINGGGTMYTHGERRDVTEVEDFLAGLANRLPFAAGKGARNAAQLFRGTADSRRWLRLAEGGVLGTRRAL